MGKLFIWPEAGRGYLKKTIDELRASKYEVHFIGYGCPPIYVDTDQNNYETVKTIAKLVDKDVKFSLYRPDIPEIMDISEWGNLIEAGELRDKILQLGNDNFITLCDNLKVERRGLAGYANGNVPEMAADLVSKHPQDSPRRIRLVEAIKKLGPDLFHANC